MHGRSRPGGGSATSGTHREAWGWLALVAAIGACLRLSFVDLPMRQDEADTVVLFALTPWRHVLVDTVIPNNHVLHSLLVKAATSVFGLSPAAVRLPALLAGIALVPLVFLLGRAVHTASAGLVAASIVAISTPLVLFSVNARGYTLLAVASVTAASCMHRAITTGDTRAWAGVALSLAFGAFVTPSMLYPAGGIALWGFLGLTAQRPLDRVQLKRFVISMVATLVLAVVVYLPAIKVSGLASIIANDFVRPLSWQAFRAALPRFAADYGAYLTQGWPPVLSGVALVCLLIGIAMRDRVRERRPLLLVMLAWSLFLLIAMRRTPFLRVLLFLVPFAAVSCGVGVAALLAGARRSRVVTWAGAAGALLALLMGWRLAVSNAPDRIAETGRFPDAQRMAERLAGELQPGDLIAARWRAQGPVDYYLRRLGVTARFAAARDSVERRVFLVASDELGESVDMIVGHRELRGVDATQARELARFPAGTIWVITPTPKS